MTPDLPWLVRAALAPLPAAWRDPVEGDLREERARRLARGQRAGPGWMSLAATRITGALWIERRRQRGARDRARRHLMHGLGSDVRQALRGLRASRGYALAAIATLALGIGATTAVFSLANWLLLRPVPGVGAPDDLVTLGLGNENGARFPVSFSDFERLRDGVAALDGVAGYQAFPLHVASAGGAPRRLDAEVVTGSYFDVLGGPIVSGRGFTAEEGVAPGAAPVAVISHRLWQSAFGGVDDVLGRDVTLNGAPFEVVGVTAPGFHGTSLNGSVELWVPIAQHARAVPTFPDGVLTSRRVEMLFSFVGRLSTGATVDQVARQADAARAALAANHPDDQRLASATWEVMAGLEPRPWARERVRRAMTILLGVVGLLLILTCANVTTLMLARTTGRRGELATRLALGASGGRVARLLLVESLLVSTGAGVAAVATTMAVAAALEGTSFLSGLPPLERSHLDWRVLGFAIAISVLAAAAAAVVPSLAAGHVRPSAILRETGRAHTARRRRWRLALTTVQLALSLTLLVGAGLLTRSMAERLATDPGFDASRVLTFSVEPGLQGYGPRQEAFYRDLLDRVRALPGVRGAGMAWLRPYSPGAAGVSVWPEGASESDRLAASMNMVSPGYFGAIGLPIVAGRDFTPEEFQRPAAVGAPVTVLTESFARKLFGDAPAVGRRLAGQVAGDLPRTVVGVVRDTRQRRLLEEEDIVFEPFGQPFPVGWASFVIGLDGDAKALLPRLHETVAALDAALPIYDVMTLDAAIRRQFADDALVMRLTGAFAILATLVAAFGVYGVMARAAAERIRELGIRVALGASGRAIARLITRDALVVFVAGAALGLPLSWWLGQFVESRLFGVGRLDPVALALSVGALGLAIALACLPVARRAARVDPAVVLKR